MKLIKRLKNIWKLSNLDLMESWQEHGYLDKTNIQHLVVKNENGIEFPKEEHRMAQIIKMHDTIKDALKQENGEPLYLDLLNLMLNKNTAKKYLKDLL